MNIQEYISSGIVESYVLGLADAAEKAEFERLCAEHAEVRAARDQFENSLEQDAFTEAIEPPAFLKDKIFASLHINTESSLPVAPLPSSDAKVVGMHPDGSRSALRWMRYLVAASVILLVGSTILNFYFFNRYKEYNDRYTQLVASQQQLAANNTTLQAKLQGFETDLAIIRNPDMAIVKLPGSNVPTSPAPTSLATVYWNLSNKDVYLMVNRMPEPASGKQFQLWALVDGKPVSAGVFDTQNATVLVRMKNIPNAQGFAITLEKRGGSEAPTMEQMYVLGTVKT